jgi:hypothetical protein
MSEAKDSRIGEIKERLVKTPEGMEHQIEDTATNQKLAVGFSMEQVMLMIKEMRKPDDETLRKREEEAARHQENLRQMIAVATAEEEAKKARWARCDHKKERGETAWVGQPYSNGFYQAICVKCQMMGTPIRINPSMMSGMA